LSIEFESLAWDVWWSDCADVKAQELPGSGNAEVTGQGLAASLKLSPQLQGTSQASPNPGPGYPSVP